MTIRGIVVRVLAMLPAALLLGVAGCGEARPPAESPAEVHPLKLDASRWVPVANPPTSPYAALHVDTAGTTRQHGFRVAWVRKRLRRPVTAGRAHDTVIDRWEIDCGSRSWDSDEHVLVHDGAEVAWEAKPGGVEFAKPGTIESNVLDLVCLVER